VAGQNGEAEISKWLLEQLHSSAEPNKSWENSGLGKPLHTLWGLEKWAGHGGGAPEKNRGKRGLHICCTLDWAARNKENWSEENGSLGKVTALNASKRK